MLTTAEAGRLGASDHEQLAFAHSQQRAIYSLNASDFARLNAEFLGLGQNHSGIVVIPSQRYSTGERIRAISHFLLSLTAEEMINRMEFL